MAATRILVTGASGFVGQHCLRPLAAAFGEVIALSRQARQSESGILWKQFDLLGENPAEIIDDVRPTHLLHLAWEATPGSYLDSPLNAAWLRSSKELLRAFAEAGGQRAVVAGSCAEYDWSGGTCREGLTPLASESPYAEAKNELFAWINSEVNTSFAWARLFFVFGPGEPAGRLIPYIWRTLIADGQATLSAGEQRRDYVYVKDVANALTDLAISGLEGAINIGSGEAQQIRAIVKAVQHAANRGSVSFGTTPDRYPLVVADVDRLVVELGYAHQFTFDQALSETLMSIGLDQRA